jgi:hypothetical protein
MMGMDVYGRKPKNGDGEYFRANVWGWRPIHALCVHAIDKFQLGFNTDYLGSNDGRGLRSQGQCDKLADALDKIVSDLENNLMDTEMSQYFKIFDHPQYGKGIEMSAPGGMMCDDQGRFISPDEAKKNNIKTHSPYSIEISYLREWIKFLRNCGGFEIC